ncbi:conjugative transposon protein TraK [Chitinophaga eiseniae]|uniref:Conjugative transposon protein TraK n=1 Tax=Chitinophaga eiseniae TaxID=634771 RepID=A0A847SCY2_9BACT|nr:conjugative transposon protein TraK [Chitinophaga eiseniae]NLR78024.1 conjugative transposon protein TraK [Chitinophaga eiseniae]
MLEQLKNIDSAFKHIRLFSIVLVLSAVLLGGFAIYRCTVYAEAVGKRIFVITNSGKALEAIAASRRDNMQVECRDHVKVFHELFFSLLPDDKAIENQISKALYLADKSAKVQYDNLKESGYYKQVVGGNISQELTMDSISVSTVEQPFHFTFYGKQKIIRPTSTVLRDLITTGELRVLQDRTDANPHGLLIEKWEIVRNNDLQIFKR